MHWRRRRALTERRACAHASARRTACDRRSRLRGPTHQAQQSYIWYKRVRGWAHTHTAKTPSHAR